MSGAFGGPLVELTVVLATTSNDRDVFEGGGGQKGGLDNHWSEGVGFSFDLLVASLGERRTLWLIPVSDDDHGLHKVPPTHLLLSS